jgi:hypothetical protein
VFCSLDFLESALFGAEKLGDLKVENPIPDPSFTCSITLDILFPQFPQSQLSRDKERDCRGGLAQGI